MVGNIRALSIKYRFETGKTTIINYDKISIANKNSTKAHLTGREKQNNTKSFFTEICHEDKKNSIARI